MVNFLLGQQGGYTKYSSFAYGTAEPRKNIISNKSGQHKHHLLSEKKYAINPP